MAKEKQIQIPEKLFVDMAKYFLLEQEDTELREIIKKGLTDKLEANIRHSLYTTSKTAPTAEEREKARKEYLDRIGVPESFRW